ncbi:MAG TPA: (Fe-S)-binding protein [Methylomirabilota bacterium]|jgi:Fe-S oxidoreductase/nitrate reductase gamma subunit|nr:(Fe-S)-binding protein [Methylomirabilota bacterium]
MSPSHHWYGVIPGWLLFYALIVAALVLFAFRVNYLIRLMLKGKPAVRWDHIPARLGKVIVFVVGQARLIGGDFWPGLMHATIFWGFIVLTLGTFEFFGKGVTESFSLPYLSNTPPYLIFEDLFSVAVIAAVAYAVFRRLVTKPHRLTLSPEALLILGLIFGLMATDLITDASRILLAPGPTDHWQFAGAGLAVLLGRLPRGAVAAAFHASWWAHAVILLGFLVWLPYSKHLHVLAAPFNVFFAPQTPKGRFQTVDLENAETFGVGTIEEFTWKDLFDLYNCTECGRCTSRCPANMAGKELDPKLLILNLREHLVENGGRHPAQAGADGGHAMVGGVIHDNVLWACTMCRWCVDACPVFIEHVPKIVDMRRWLVLTESRFPNELQPAFRNLENNGNPWQMSWQARTDWAKDLGVRLMSDVQEAEYLYWVGCYGSFDERNKKVARAFVKILQAAGVDFAILGTEERCTGEPARRLGHEYLYQTLAQGNIETLKRYRFQTIVTACPHCFNTIRNEYPDFDGHFRVIHHSQLLDDLVRAGRLQVTQQPGERITYHDACNLGRYNDVYDEPRRVLASATRGELVEMRLNRSRGYCCGGGGGRVWLEEHEGRRVNQVRVEQAMEVNPDILASACPFCLTMFEDGVKAKEVADRIKTRDIAEILAERLG